MNDVLHANVFFLITSTATVLISLVLFIILIYVARIVRDVSDIIAKLNKASTELEEDFEDLRREIKSEGAKVRTIVDVGLGFLISRMQKKTAARKRKSEEEDNLQQ